MEFFRCLILYFSIVVCCSSAPLRNNDWDHFVFAMEWPESICMQLIKTEQGQCNMPDETNFWTIHGLWPTLSNSRGPNFCPGKKFNESMLSPIKDKLITKWPDMLPSNKHSGLWKHEWEKHGTCAGSMEGLNSELKYFSKGIDLQESYDVLGGLVKQGFTPSDDNTYQYGELQDAFNSFLKVPALMMCYNPKDDPLQYLSQVEFCLDKSFKTMRCPHHKIDEFSQGALRSIRQLQTNKLRDNYFKQVFNMKLREKLSLSSANSLHGALEHSEMKSTTREFTKGLDISIHVVPCVEIKPILYPVIKHN